MTDYMINKPNHMKSSQATAQTAKQNIPITPIHAKTSPGFLQDYVVLIVCIDSPTSRPVCRITSVTDQRRIGTNACGFIEEARAAQHLEETKDAHFPINSLPRKLLKTVAFMNIRLSETVP
jgi:hypothetical protein